MNQGSSSQPYDYFANGAWASLGPFSLQFTVSGTALSNPNPSPVPEPAALALVAAGCAAIASVRRRARV